MKIRTVSRERFLEVLRPGGKISASTIAEETQRGLYTESIGNSYAIGLAWEETDDEGALPRAIVIDHDKKRDFLAWVVTYFSEFRPFTAYFRVLSKEFVAAYSANDVADQRRDPSLGGLEDVCLGLVFGEMLSVQKGNKERWRGQLWGSLSFVLARALAVGMRGMEPDLLATAWTSARKLTNQTAAGIRADSVKAPWAVVERLVSSTDVPLRDTNSSYSQAQKQIEGACLELKNTGGLGKGTWNRLARGLSFQKDIRSELEGTRESRVTHIERALRELTDKPRGESASFLCGYLVSCVSTGTLNHHAMIEPVLETYPSSALWYGVCAGLHRGADLKNQFEGMGRRVLRDLLRPESLLDPPRADIAISELEMLHRDPKRADFFLRSPNRIEVEIAPCVDTMLPWQREEYGQENRRVVEADLWHAFTELEDALARISRPRRKLLNLLEQLHRRRQ